MFYKIKKELVYIDSITKKRPKLLEEFREDTEVLADIASNTKTSPEVLHKITLITYNSYILSLVAANPNIREDTAMLLFELFEYGNSIKMKLAANPNLPKSLFYKIIQILPEANQEILGNKNCPTDIIETFYDTDAYLLKILISSNPNTSEKFLSKLSEDDDIRIKFNVARNTNTPSEILSKLTKQFLSNLDYQEDIWKAVAKNSNVSEKTLKYMVWNTYSNQILIAICDSPNISYRVAKKISYAMDWKVRAHLARSTKYIDIILRYIEDDVVHVREALAYNSNISEDVLEYLGRDESKVVRKAAFANPNMTFSLKLKIYGF